MALRPLYKIVDREYHNETWDLLHVEITYRGKSPRKILNRYKVLKHEKRVPRDLMKDRKYDTQPLDGKKWIEGSIKGRRMKGRFKE